MVYLWRIKKKKKKLRAFPLSAMIFNDIHFKGHLVQLPVLNFSQCVNQFELTSGISLVFYEHDIPDVVKISFGKTPGCDENHRPS